MRVTYCDLCNCPLKEEDVTILYTASKDELVPQEAEAYQQYMNKLKEETKEICPSCKQIFDLIFQLRMRNLNEISNDLLGIYNLPCIPKDKKVEEKKRGKRKDDGTKK